jgi:hypothetical protein
MRLEFFFVGCVLALIISAGCSSTITYPSDCPVTTVTLDAGIDGLPDVGEYSTGRLCESLCGPGLTVCRRVEELVLKCQPGCE